MSGFQNFIQMATAKRQSNIERGKWRLKCREILCNHIWSTLHIRIEPSQVRLHTTRDDAYRWKVLPEKRHLFDKNLSEQSISVYKELCDGVGVIFEATHPDTETSDANTGETSFSSIHNSTVSFTGRINELQIQNNYSAQQLHFLKSQLEAEVKLRLSVEEKLKISYERLEILKEELQKVSRREDFFRHAAHRYSQAMSQVVPMMKDLFENPPITETGFI